MYTLVERLCWSDSAGATLLLWPGKQQIRLYGLRYRGDCGRRRNSGQQPAAAGDVAWLPASVDDREREIHKSANTRAIMLNWLVTWVALIECSRPWVGFAPLNYRYSTTTNYSASDSTSTRRLHYPSLVRSVAHCFWRERAKEGQSRFRKRIPWKEYLEERN